MHRGAPIYNVLNIATVNCDTPFSQWLVRFSWNYLVSNVLNIATDNCDTPFMFSQWLVRFSRNYLEATSLHIRKKDTLYIPCTKRKVLPFSLWDWINSERRGLMREGLHSQKIEVIRMN